MHIDDPEYRALCAAVRNDPAAEQPRLDLAVWLDLNPGTKGTGRSARAELIRCQLERGRTVCTHRPQNDISHDITYPPDCKVCVLRKRERDFLARFGPSWSAGPQCLPCDGSGMVYRGTQNSLAHLTCPTCQGAGHTSVLAADPKYTVYENGMPVVLVKTPDAIDRSCARCSSHLSRRTFPCTGCSRKEQNEARPQQWIVDLLTVHPDIATVRLTDREPVLQFGESKALADSPTAVPAWWSMSCGDPGAGCMVPEPVQKLMTTSLPTQSTRAGLCVEFGTREAARGALDAATTRWVVSYTETET